MHPNVPADTDFHLVRMRRVKHPKTPGTVWRLAVAWWYRSGCSGIIWLNVDIPSAFCLINTSVKYPVDEIPILPGQQVHQFQHESIYYLVNHTLGCLCDSWHCDYHYWFNSWSKLLMPLRWSWLDLEKALGHVLWSQHWIPHSIFTNSSGIVFLCHIHPFVMAILPQNWQQQPHKNLLSLLLAYHSHCHWG